MLLFLSAQTNLSVLWRKNRGTVSADVVLMLLSYSVYTHHVGRLFPGAQNPQNSSDKKLERGKKWRKGTIMNEQTKIFLSVVNTFLDKACNVSNIS